MEPVKEFIVAKVGEFVLSRLLESLYDRFAVPKFWDLIRREGEGLEANLDNWRQKLKDIQKMLDAAEERQYSDPAVKDWLNDLKHLVYDVDDIVDELATKASTAAENQARPRKLRKLNILGASSSTHQIDSTLLSKIKEVTDQFNGIVTRKEKLNLKETADERSHGKTDVRAPTSVLTEPEHHVYGRDKDKMAIVELLVGEKYCSDAQLSVIPILGMGGIGKTTLAQLVYNDEAIQKSFDLKAWACVSQDFDVDRVTKRILQPLTSDNCGGKDRNWLQVKLKEKLQGKKFLVVLDDLWNDDYDNWIILRAPFLVGTPGSKIIITTRNLKVSSMTGTAKAHYLPLLSDDDCFSIFTRHALGASNFSAHSNLQDIGKKIVERCKGLPLVARTLGGLLRTKKEERNEWEAVLKSKIWDIPEARSGIVPALMLSYHHLPSHLKRCFMYCSILPEDYEFKEQQLVLLWMAEGLIQPPEGDKLQMEDLGSEYFHDLLSRSFFQQSSMKKFVMHDLIKDLAQRVAGDICFRMEDEIWGGNRRRLPKNIRHSSYLGGNYDIAKKFEPFFELKCLRTFLPLPPLSHCYLTHSVPLQLLPKLKSLRVLSLRGYCIVELPDSIGDLKHLRYLDLSYTKIRGLPESTTTLCNLQTMILEECYSLKELPSNLGNLFNLRHLNILSANKLEGMPSQIGKLTHLQTLSNLIVGKGSCFTLRELGSLLHLRGTLIISQLENATEPRDASDAKLIDKTNLTTLYLEWSVNKDDLEESEFDVISMLQPHNDLKELTIRQYGGTKFPTWFGHSLLHMVLLRIENCKKCTSLPPVGHLPSLKRLFIRGMASVKDVGHEFYGVSCSQPFESLETLNFMNMVEWEKWSPNGEFPNLRELSISDCPKLSGKLPNHFPSLGKVVIERCQQLVISTSSFPNDCKLQIEGSKATMCDSKVNFSSLHMSSLSILEFTPPPTEGLLLEGLTHVEDLAFKNCEELTPLWSNDVGLLQHLPNLRVLTFDNCSKLVSLAAEKANEQPQSDLPKAVIYNNSCLERIYIDGCDSLKHIARGQLPPTLKRLRIWNCKNMLSLVDEDDANCCSTSSTSSLLEFLEIWSCPSLKFVELPATLQRLYISNCGQLESIAKSEELPATLQQLWIWECGQLESIAKSEKLPATLQLLCIRYCGQLESIAKSFHHNSSLKIIDIGDCKNLKSLPTGMHALSHLDEIEISGCPALASFPDGGLLPTNLRKLTIVGDMALPNVVSVVSSFSEEGFPANLTSLTIGNCNFTQALLEWGLHGLTSLQHLRITGGCPNVESFPEKMLPASLTTLEISRFPNLKYMSSLQSLTSLEMLHIEECENLTSFPEDGLPPSLLILRVSYCPLLKEHCKKDQGREWSKIAHIPRVEIDNRSVFGS